MKTETYSRSLQNFRLLRVLCVIVLVTFGFSCESEMSHNETLEEEEITQVPPNWIPSPRPPLTDDYSNSAGDAVFDVVENPPLPT